MSAQDTIVLNWSTRHREETVFEALTDAIASLEEIDRVLLDEYRVIWETEDRNHDSTSYTITGFGTSVGETTLKIRGGRGGDYEIFPKPNFAPWIVYTHSRAGWEEELTKLAILSPDFQYIEKNGWRSFLSNASEILEEIRP